MMKKKTSQILSAICLTMFLILPFVTTTPVKGAQEIAGGMSDTIQVFDISSQNASSLKVSSSNKQIKAKIGNYPVNGTRYYNVLVSVNDARSAKEAANITIQYYNKKNKKTVRQTVKVAFYDGYEYNREHFILLNKGKSATITSMKRTRNVSQIYYYVNNMPGNSLANVINSDNSQQLKFSRGSASNSLMITGQETGKDIIKVETTYLNGEVLWEEYPILVVDENKSTPINVIQGQTTQIYYELPVSGTFTIAKNSSLDIKVQQLTKQEYYKYDRDEYLAGYNKNMVLLLVSGLGKGDTTIKVTYKNSSTKKTMEFSIPVQVLADEDKEEGQTIFLVDTIPTGEYRGYLTDQAGNQIEKTPLNLDARLQYVLTGEPKAGEYLDTTWNGADYYITNGKGRQNICYYVAYEKDLYGTLTSSYRKKISFHEGTIQTLPEYEGMTHEEAIDFFCEGEWSNTNADILKLKKSDNSVTAYNAGAGSPWAPGDWEIGEVDGKPFFAIDEKAKTITITEAHHRFIIQYQIINQNSVLYSYSGKKEVFSRGK